MPTIEVLGKGCIDDRDSAFPTLVRCPDGRLLAAFCVGGGPSAMGSTDWAWSDDNGEHWRPGGTILPAEPAIGATNHLRLSRRPNGELLAWGLRLFWEVPGQFGKYRSEPVLVRSADGGRTWDAPVAVPSAYHGNWEITDPVLVLSDGSLLAPGSTLPAMDRVGEQVLVMRSTDGGQTWPQTLVAMQDPHGRNGYVEQKLVELAPGRVMALAWTISLGQAVDQENHFALSNDGGLTWTPPLPTGIRGQTMKAISLGDERLLVLYNQRTGATGVKLCLVRLVADRWVVEYQGTLYDAGQTGSDAGGIARFSGFQFGHPYAVRLSGDECLAAWWCKEDGSYQVRWARLRVQL